jgi:hypothetical protein
MEYLCDDSWQELELLRKFWNGEIALQEADTSNVEESPNSSESPTNENVQHQEITYSTMDTVSVVRVSEHIEESEETDESEVIDESEEIDESEKNECSEEKDTQGKEDKNLPIQVKLIPQITDTFNSKKTMVFDLYNHLVYSINYPEATDRVMVPYQERGIVCGFTILKTSESVAKLADQYAYRKWYSRPLKDVIRDQNILEATREAFYQKVVSNVRCYFEKLTGSNTYRFNIGEFLTSDTDPIRAAQRIEKYMKSNKKRDVKKVEIKAEQPKKRRKSCM